jgi:hypothetical protein
MKVRSGPDSRLGHLKHRRCDGPQHLRRLTPGNTVADGRWPLGTAGRHQQSWRSCILYCGRGITSTALTVGSLDISQSEQQRLAGCSSC